MKFQKESNPVSGDGGKARIEAHGRWYPDACAASFALELMGERWSMHVMRELMLGPRRFSDIRAALPGISAKVLTERLARLEELGVLIRRKLPPPAAAQVYELTPWGLEAEDVMQALGRWSVRSPLHDPTLPLTAVSAMLSLRTMIDPASAGGRNAVIGFEFGEDRFVARLADGDLTIARAEDLAEAQAVFRADTAGAMLPLFYGKRDADEVTAMTGLEIIGDRAAALRFAALFSLPPKIGT
ncbi:winged helix-turn-helix transcriptional regulator [Croceicoccus mobilis]|uniref:Transcriptional regulator n=1 Tax=Croceicoccus mobilis TaxID=1703339 RepID=A0A916Z605_9SPHN|nr:winged helix-turn-helix transcriptional regulator [Croceicoccus mobilis]GGD77561.1 transcriptional regulator [Croceicoccus mobilis]